MIERSKKRRGLFPNFPAPLNGKFHSITIRETIMRIALEVILTMPEVDGVIARDIAREALQQAFPLKARRELEHDRSEIYHFERVLLAAAREPWCLTLRCCLSQAVQKERRQQLAM